MLKYTLSLLAVVALGTLPVVAQTAPLSTEKGAIPQSSPDPHSSDRSALTYALQDSVAEVSLCKLALSKTSNSAVRSFANRMIAEHTAMIGQVQQLGGQNGMGAMPLEPSDEGMIELAHLNRYAGHQFDEEFLHAQIEDHRGDIDTLRAAMEASQSNAVKTWAKQTLNQLDTHLELANDTLNVVEASNS